MLRSLQEFVHKVQGNDAFRTCLDESSQPVGDIASWEGVP